MACYETQTKPTSVEQLRAVAIQGIVDKHIFGIAKTLDLTPDVKATGGGDTFPSTCPPASGTPAPTAR